MSCNHLKNFKDNIVHEIYDNVKKFAKIYTRKVNIINEIGLREDISNEIRNCMENSDLSCYDLCVKILCIWSNRILKSQLAPDNESVQYLWEEVRRKYSILLKEKEEIYSNFSENYIEAKEQLNSIVKNL